MPTTTKRYRDFTVIFKDPDLNGFHHPNDFINHCKLINFEYLRYLVFQWARSNDETYKTFYQMYFEFSNNMSIKRIQSEFFNSLDVIISSYDGIQEEAIKNCTDLNKKLVIKDYFDLGEAKIKRNYHLTNQTNKSIPSSQKEQIMHIIEETKKGTYKSLKDIEKDYPYLSYSKKIVLQDIIYRNTSNKKKNVEPARVIWLFGESGSGKTTWTDKFLNEMGYSDDEITTTSPISLQNYQTVWFNLEDQDKKVLVVNEVNKTFPNDNNLIAWIDRKDSLQVKGARIRNNFELIIINSIYRPEEIFYHLGKIDGKQTLRRIFNNYIDSRVYKINANYEQLEEAKSLKLNSIEFENWYQPIVELIPEPDYSLMKD